MKTLAKLLPLLLLAACASGNRRLSSDDTLPWARLGGVESAVVNGELTVVRADPRATPVTLLNPPESAGSVAEVAVRRKFAFVTNAAMFQQDYVTSIGYMRNFAVVNNARVSAKLHGFLLLHPKRAGLPAVKLGGPADLDAYDTVVQTHRVWTPADGILWTKGASVYEQVALVGADDQNRILFFYHPQLADVHDLVARILELNLHLTGLLYLDGGHHGTLFLAPELGRSENTWISLPNVLALPAP